jgi:hypothetical protein
MVATSRTPAFYEMVLRRCQVIVVSDGAQDEDYHFTDLGNAVRKIRIDLGVPIEFASVPIYAESPAPGKGMYWAIAKVRYSCIDGPEVKTACSYIKPAVYGNEPRDVPNTGRATRVSASIHGRPVFR